MIDENELHGMGRKIENASEGITLQIEKKAATAGALSAYICSFIAYVINVPCTFTHYLELSNFQFYFMIWIVVF